MLTVTQQNPAPTLSEVPDWLERDALCNAPHGAPSALMLEWLFDQDSLTRRLSALSANSFSVTLLLEGWQALRADECAALALAPDSLGWVREVYLRGHGEKWVFARSVAARSALQAGGLNMDELGTRSLGELLFSDAAFTRGAFEVCHYPKAWLPAADASDALWGRRSCFTRGELSVLVAEIFLPTLWQAIDNREHC